MTPKSLLRHPEARSAFSEFTSGGFQTVLDDPDAAETADRLLVCSGHVWYDLNTARKAAVRDNPQSPAARTCILRLEQYYPFPDERLNEIMKKYPGIKQRIWVQEEPANRGAWSFVGPRLEELTGSRWEYVGRKPSASPATGSHQKHEEERDALLSAALGITPDGRNA
jgi:2-oxoglutarate dehydrogenase complex dehydrogenase (E1) component-like enzyme